MQHDIWLPSKTPNSKAVGRFVDGEHTFTDAQGEEKTVPVLWLYTKVPGLDHETSSQRVKDNPDGKKLKAEYAAAWELYTRNKAAPKPDLVPTATEYGVKGSPIEELNFLGKDQLARLKLSGFLTAEQLADMSDMQCQNVGFGAKTWRKKAKDFVALKQAS